MQFANPILKALIFDVAVTAILMPMKNLSFDKLATVGAASFASYFVRGIANEYSKAHVVHTPAMKFLPVVVGAVAGALKYYSKGSDAEIGAFNNAAYEFSSGFMPKAFDDYLAPMVIEGVDNFTSYSKSVLGISNVVVDSGSLHSVIFESNFTINDSVDALKEGAGIGAIVLGLAPIYVKYMETDVNPYNKYVVASIAAGLISKNAYDLYNKYMRVEENVEMISLENDDHLCMVQDNPFVDYCLEV